MPATATASRGPPKSTYVLDSRSPWRAEQDHKRSALPEIVEFRRYLLHALRVDVVTCRDVRNDHKRQPVGRRSHVDDLQRLAVKNALRLGAPGVSQHDPRRGRCSRKSSDAPASGRRTEKIPRATTRSVICKLAMCSSNFASASDCTWRTRANPHRQSLRNRAEGDQALTAHYVWRARKIDFFRSVSGPPGKRANSCAGCWRKE